MLQFEALLLSTNQSRNFLSELYAVLLLKIRLMKTFLVVLRRYLLPAGGLGLWSFKVGPVIQVINCLISLCLVNILSRLPLKTTIEHAELDISAFSLFLSEDCKRYSNSAAKSWLVLL